MKNIKFIYPFLAVLMISISCTNEQYEEEKAIRSVRYLKIEKQNIDDKRTYSGYAVASQEVELSFRNNGIVTEKLVKVGQKVKKGDLLMRLDNVKAKLSFEQSLSALNAAKSDMLTAKSEYIRGKVLYEKGNFTLSKYETLKNTFENAINQYASAERKLAIDKEQIRFGYIYAPKDGTIAAVEANLNETVSNGQTVIKLNEGDGINVMVGVPENVISQINQHETVALNFTSSDEILSGRVTEISPIIDNESATFPVKIELEEIASSIYSGMVTEVTFNFSSDQEVHTSIVLPLSAVGEDQEGNFVYYITKDQGDTATVHKRKIQVGDLLDHGIIIESGLTEGDMIVTAGLQTLLTGQTVKL
ncbi:efflux RND transporter periplasmic adaptor subunit [Flammeovirga sp. SubArs3]|uniref:efflux RND transporter periplasmic adaptor subunit n=1 Tax=Flammeovirga sp. SubArs3 TaxID=2995316 RepID=UPI00248CD1EF|nr:efflux RND transporter periplasmic adaptor subunit [Flammeovirga sp. SubArs3]